MESKVVQIRARGNLTLPARLRERYGLTEGDPVTLVDLDGVILLAPKTGIVPNLAAELEKLREDLGVCHSTICSPDCPKNANAR